MIDIVLIAISAVTSLGAVWLVSRTRHGWYVDTPPALDALVPTDEQLQREREAYILLRTTWKPAPGSPLDWSLGLLQDECQKKIEARKRPPAPTGTSATSRGRGRRPPDGLAPIPAIVAPKPVTDLVALLDEFPDSEPTPPPPRGGSGQATARDKFHDWGSSITYKEEASQRKEQRKEQLREIEHLYRVGAISAWQMLREVGKVQIGDQEAIRQLRADTQYLRALRAGTNQLPPPNPNLTQKGYTS
jgi:hypothetical protein